jgi:hypothetical protein
LRIKPFYEETHKTDNPNYWILVVTDKLEQDLTAKQILTTRMNDKFWGLNAKTPSRTLLRKNDRVVFSYGAKEFLGTAVLDSDPFELTEEQANQFSHGNEFFKTNFGVRLRETELWEDPKPVRKYVDVLSFIKNKSTLCPVCGKYGFLTKRWVQGCYYPKLFHDAIDESDTKAVVMTRATRRKYRYTRKYYHFTLAIMIKRNIQNE